MVEEKRNREKIKQWQKSKDKRKMRENAWNINEKERITQRGRGGNTNFGETKKKNPGKGREENNKSREKKQGKEQRAEAAFPVIRNFNAI